MQSMGYGLDQLAKRQFIDATPTPSPQTYQQSHPFCAGDLAVISFVAITFLVFFRDLFIDEMKRELHLVSQCKIVGLKSSTKWGVPIPNKKEKIPLMQKDSVEVVTLHLGKEKNLELNKEIWKLSSLKLLRADNPLSKVQTNIINAVRQKLDLQADLEQLTAHTQKAKEMYELAKGLESAPEIVRKYEDIYLQNLAAISQLNISQTLQDENIKQLLLFVEIVKFDKENIVANSQHRPETITETKQNYLESVDRVKEYLKLQA